MKNVLAAFAIISSTQPVLAQDLECASNILYAESLGLMTGMVNIEASFSNDFDKNITSVSWSAKNSNGETVFVAENSILTQLGLPGGRLKPGEATILLKQIPLRTQHQGMDELSEEEKEIMRDNFEERVEKNIPKYSELLCSVVRVSFEDGTSQEL